MKMSTRLALARKPDLFKASGPNPCGQKCRRSAWSSRACVSVAASGWSPLLRGRLRLFRGCDWFIRFVGGLRVCFFLFQVPFQPISEFVHLGIFNHREMLIGLAEATGIQFNTREVNINAFLLGVGFRQGQGVFPRRDRIFSPQRLDAVEALGVIGREQDVVRVEFHRALIEFERFREHSFFVNAIRFGRVLPKEVSGCGEIFTFPVTAFYRELV